MTDIDAPLSAGDADTDLVARARRFVHDRNLPTTVPSGLLRALAAALEAKGTSLTAAVNAHVTGDEGTGYCAVAEMVAKERDDYKARLTAATEALEAVADLAPYADSKHTQPALKDAVNRARRALAAVTADDQGTT